MDPAFLGLQKIRNVIQNLWDILLPLAFDFLKIRQDLAELQCRKGAKVGQKGPFFDSFVHLFKCLRVWQNFNNFFQVWKIVTIWRA